MDFLRHLKIKSRLIISLFITSLIPIIVLGVYSAKRSTEAVKSKTERYAMEIMTQVNLNISTALYTYSNLADEIILNETVNNSLNNFDQLTEDELLDARVAINAFLYERYRLLQKLTSIELFTEDKQHLYSSGYYSEELPWSDYIDMAEASSHHKYWSGQYFKERNNIMVTVKINDLSLRRMTTGYLIIVFEEDLISDLYREADLGEGAELFITNTDGKIISAKNPQLIGAREDNLIPQLEGQKGILKSGRDGIIVYSKINKTDWYLVSKIPGTYILYETNQILGGILFMVLAVLCVCIIVSIMVTGSILRPLNHLIGLMRRIQHGNLDEELTTKFQYKDEFAFMERRFFSMQLEIRHLLKRVEKEQNDKRNAEIRALQAQINPHFLFNTLNTLKWVAMINQSKTIEKGLGALALLLRNTILQTAEEITLGEELSNIEAYITIQRIRYGDTFTYEEDIEEEILQAKVLRFILQPFVENAIIHGLDGIDQGALIITAKKLKGDLYIEIRDNGKGFHQDQLDNKRKGFTSVGISNVAERIRLNYGEEYEVSIVSDIDRGTKVSIVVPFKN